MIVQCPECQAKYRLEEKQFAGRSEIKVRCTKCGAIFPARAAAGVKVAAAKPASPPPMPEVTLVSGKGGGPQLPATKTVALSATQGPLKGTVFPITKPRVVLGRVGADIVMADPEVSRKHCALEVHGSTALLVDLGSTNGTFVDKDRVDTYELEHLSEFRIGATTLMFTVTNKE
ncbi:MAG: FHA domain-containing protein [Terriglobia bacterium]